MDVLLALQVLRELISGAGAFAGAVAQAHAEGRPLTPEEVALARSGAQASLDALDAKIKAAGG